MAHHNFGTEEKLFLETVSVPFDPRQYIHLVVEGPREQLAERLLTTALTVWDSLPDSPPARCCAVRRSTE